MQPKPPTFLSVLTVPTNKFPASLHCAPRHTVSMTANPATGRVSLLTGATLLSALLINRLIFTPLDTLAVSQSRSDLLGVVSAATLVLYGVGRADIAARAREAVPLDGFDVRQGIEEGGEVEWLMEGLMGGNVNVRSCALFVGEAGTCFLGRFRDKVVEGRVVPGGVVDSARREGRRIYLADLKTVPVKEIEFGYLPRDCQVSCG